MTRNEIKSTVLNVACVFVFSFHTNWASFCSTQRRRGGMDGKRKVSKAVVSDNELAIVRIIIKKKWV